jgi:hypothetical protein
MNPTSARRSTVVWSLLAAALGGSAGCGDAGSGVNEGAGVVTDGPLAPAAAPEGAQVLLRARQTELPDWARDNLSRRDPAVDRWPSEVLHDRAKKVLGEFLRLACGEKDWSEEELAHVLAPSFRGATLLRPEGLRTVFDDGSARVLRPAELPHELQAPERLPELAARLRAAFADGKCRWFTKIVRVDLKDGGRFRTAALVHTDGRAPDGLLQQNMDWELEWVAVPGEAPEEDAVRIEAIRLEHYDELWLAQAPLAELELHVFGANPAFREELLHGVQDYQNRVDRLIGGPFLGMQGIAVGDVNGDGLEDVYLAQHHGTPNRLFLHQPDGTALDATASSRAGLLENTRGVLILDWDEDGDQDLLLAVGPALVSARNDGAGVFHDFQLARAESPGDIYSLSAADPDGDGDLDVYACRYAESGILFGLPVPYHDADNGNPNIYFRNEGGRFTVATAEVGLDQNNRKFSLASLWEDFDGDGDLDLFVSNDFGRDNLYRNEGGRFTDVAGEVGADDISAGMGVSASDFDLDEDMDLYITNMFSSAGQRIVPQSELFMGGEHTELHRHYQRHARGNTLLANRGDGTFEDVTDAAGVAVGGWGWGARFVDYNNDGLDDVYAPDGFITNKQPDDL